MDAFLLGASAGDARKGISHRVRGKDDLVAHQRCRVEHQCRRLGSASLKTFQPLPHHPPQQRMPLAYLYRQGFEMNPKGWAEMQVSSLSSHSVAVPESSNIDHL
jgi:hypothetical protein